MAAIARWLVACALSIAICILPVVPIANAQDGGRDQQVRSAQGAWRRPVVVLDPGHTPTIGAMSADGSLREDELTLALALKLAPLLEQRGFIVYLTREASGRLIMPVRDDNNNGKIDDHEELQPRTDLANVVGADIVVSLHFNGSADPQEKGTSVYYASIGPYIRESVRLGEYLQAALVAALRRSGYQAPDWGVLSDEGLKPYGTLYSLGQNPQFARKGRWPAVLIEPLFLTNTDDAAFLKRPDALDIIAHGCARAIGAYFGVQRSRTMIEAY